MCNLVKKSNQIEKELIVEQLVTNIKDLPQTDYEKEYIDKIVAIEINSRDRKDIDVGNDNAYSFSVKFDSGENHKTIGLSEGIKNIVKVTLSHIIIPNIGNNISIGTIFSILPFYNGSIENSLKQNGKSQLCAGFFVYGPQTTLILSLGKGVHSFYYDNTKKQFNILNPNILIPESTSEFSINSSYRRYWNNKVKNYIKNCEDGTDGVREKNFNMRWVGSLVADASRIFERGGIFLYPEDKREKNKSGRLRLTYEANPISFLISQAGGKATNGSIDILNVEVNEIHQRVPFIFGSKEEVEIFLNTN